MPRLKELSMQGFKSFADNTSFIFTSGITAVVGPNGSGKSNVADGIRWVLGEQRMRSLRGRSGEDMIFAGSKRRSRAGMSRVALTFDNTDGWLPLDFAEVTIERRSYRSGDNEYLLNGSKVRLMDLRDILDRAGLGRDAYLFIGQGLVDQVLSLRPRERLALFEQAAGIAPYRTRRDEALKRLEDTQHNAERAEDIVGEIEPRLRRLEKQAARAEQHARLSEALRETLRTWYGYRWGKLLNDLEAARQRVAYHEQRALQRLEAADQMEASIGEARQQMVELRSRLTELHRESSARHAQAEALQRELAVSRERRRLLRERQEEGRANLIPLRTALAAGEETLTALLSELAEAAAALESERAQLAEAEAAHKALEDQRHALLRQQSAVQSRALENRHQLADRQSRLEQSAERLGQLSARARQLQADLEATSERRHAQQDAVEAARRVLEEHDAELARLAAEEERLQATRERVRGELERLRRGIADKEAALQQVNARLEALERLHAEGAGLYAGVRAALQAVERGALRGLPGTVAALVQVPPDLERAIETALGGQLQDVIADDWRAAQAAVEWLKQQRAGRATFLPLDTLRPPAPLELPVAPDVVGLASDLLHYEARLQPAVLLLLGRTAVARTLDAARALHQKLSGGFQIVTLEGEILRSGGALTGGDDQRERGGSLLSRERERRELPEQVAQLEAEIATLRDTLRQGEQQLKALGEETQALAERLRAAQQRRRAADRQLEEAVRALEKTIQEIGWQENLLKEAQQERERLEASRARLEQEREAAAAAIAEAEAALAGLAGSLDALADDETAARVAERRTQAALLAQEHENRRVLLETRERELQRLQHQITDQDARLTALVEELAALAGQLEATQAHYETERATADALSGQIPPLEAELARLEQAQEAREKLESDARRALREAEQRLSQVEMDARRREDQVQNLRREIEEALGIVVGDLPESFTAQQPLPLTAIVSPLPVVTELPEGLEQQIRDLRTQIRQLEPVNYAAQEEYQELAERHGFLREQLLDLESASAHLRQVVTELDGMMETAFETTFKAINAEFTTIFEMLFNGGTAKLTITSENGEQGGVEIMARPPGKRTWGLGMLSGGERTLTAVALLFAVLRVSPTPFCILDEVDAMLDEANVGRFRAMLRELGRQTQFIIITHNRGTVEVSDTIYGVSMGEDSVSQVLSLSLEDLPPSEVI